MHKSNKFTYVLFIFISLILSFSFVSCEEEQNEDEMIVRYGISFGECIGYCHEELSISDEESTYIKQNSDTAKPDLFYNLDNTEDAKESLFDAIDLNTFTELANVIGCPDCADGGAEWIEITQGEIHHKVTFEYMNEPTNLKAYIGTLRMILSDAQKATETQIP